MNSKLLTFNQPDSKEYKFFREIRTNIELLINNNGYKSFLITGIKEGEGKTFIISNLAAMFSKSFGKTLLVDFNIRKPDINNYFGLDNKNGIVNYLENTENLDKFIKTNDEISNLDLITVGETNKDKNDLFSPIKVKDIMKRFHDNYGLILIDSPSIDLTPEVKILSSLCDATIFIVSRGRIDYRNYDEIVKEFENYGGNPVGSIFNYV